MKRYNLTAPKKYIDKSTNEEKTTYPQVGKLTIWEATGDKRESVTVELFMFPGVTYKAFPDEPRDGQMSNGNGFNQGAKPVASAEGVDELPPEGEEINLDDIPF